LAEWAKFAEWKKRIRKFHEVSTKGRKLRIPILSQIGDMLGLGGSGPRVEISESNETTVEVRDGVRIHTVETEYQHGKQEIRVLLPDDYQNDRSYAALYVLGVEPEIRLRSRRS
jgi:hypothetical protein